MRTNRETLIAAMQRAWDAGGDPARSPEVQRILERDPELLEEFAAWRDRVQSLSGTQPGVQLPQSREGAGCTGATAASKRPTRWVAAAAALLLGLMAAWWWRPWHPSDPRTTAGPTTTPLDPLSADGKESDDALSGGYFVSDDLQVLRRETRARTASTRHVLFESDDTWLVITNQTTFQ